jgi:hypothetical protein
MTIGNMVGQNVADKTELKRQLLDTQSISSVGTTSALPIFKVMDMNEIDVQDRALIATTRNIGTSWVWGHTANAVWGTSNWGDYRSAPSTVRIVHPNDTYKEWFYDDIFQGVGTFDTTNHNVVLGGVYSISTGCVLAYPLNENSGTIITDRSSSGANGSFASGGATWTAGTYDTALGFASSKAGTISDNSALNISTKTMMAWVKTVAGGGVPFGIFDYASGGAFAVGLHTGDGRPGYADNPNGFLDAGTTVNDGSWHHVSVVLDDASNTYAFYIDGIARGNGACAGGFVTTANYKHISNNPGAGTLDEVKIFNYAMSQAQVQTEMNTPLLSATSGTTSSNQIYMNSSTVTGAVLMADYSGSVNWQMSANGGTSWQDCYPNTAITFSTPGTDLRWRSIGIGTVNSLSIEFTTA